MAEQSANSQQEENHEFKIYDEEDEEYFDKEQFMNTNDGMILSDALNTTIELNTQNECKSEENDYKYDVYDDEEIVKITPQNLSQHKNEDNDIEEEKQPQKPSKNKNNDTNEIKMDEDISKTYTLLDTDDDLSKPLPLPYKTNCKHKMKYYMESFLVIHPRIYALYLLYKSTWSRGLVIFDMYTDFIVAYGLYKGNEKIWFMLSCLFIALPFVLVWSASLRFIQNYVQKLFNTFNTKKSKKSTFIRGFINILLIIYMFPPIGSVFIALYEIYWVLSDIFNGIKAFVFGNGLIEAEDQQTKAMKSYRRAIEIFAESIPQTLLQLYIFIRLNQQKVEDSDIGIDPNDLYLSLAVSAFNLFINFYNFRNEANLHGMSWAEYALSVLQLAEVPVIKLVPRIHAIRKGYIEEINFSGFVFDKESVTPLLEAVNSVQCKLKTIKLSIGSLSNLDHQSCRMLGNVLQNAGLKVLMSRTSSLLDIKNLFERIDVDHNGYLDENEFLSALKTLNCSIQNATTKQQQRIFQKLAIRRIKKRDRVYFYDFFHNTASLKDNKNFQVDFDLTLIDYPLHFIFLQIKQSIESISDGKAVDETKEKIMLNNMTKLYQFCKGLAILTQIDETMQQHVFYSIIDVFRVIQKVKDKNKIISYQRFVDSIFENLLKLTIFDGKFYFQRNNVFISHESDSEIMFLPELKAYGCSGYNIFEHCFGIQADKDDMKDNENNVQCKAFVHIFGAFLKLVNKNTKYLQELITKSAENNENGELYHLFKATNGFHAHDVNKNTPLHYAAHIGHSEVIEFFANIVFKMEVSDDINLDWINDEDYLFLILNELLTTICQDPDPQSFEALLSSNKINVNRLRQYHDSSSYGYLGHQILHLRDISHSSDKNEYLLKCLTVLLQNKYKYNILNKDKTNENTILHYATYKNDVEGISVIIASQSSSDLETLLNVENKQNETALHIALTKGHSDIANVLMRCQQQQFGIASFLSEMPVTLQLYQLKDKAFIRCFYAMISGTNGEILDKFDKNEQTVFMNYLKSVFESVAHKKDAKQQKESNVFARYLGTNNQEKTVKVTIELMISTILSYLLKKLGITDLLQQIAFSDDSDKIKSMVTTNPQLPHYGLFVKKIQESSSWKQWIICLSEIIEETNGLSLKNDDDVENKKKLYNEINMIYNAAMFIKKSSKKNVQSDKMKETFPEIKCVVVGGAVSGKTCMLTSYTANAFPEEYVPTSVDDYSADVFVDGKPIQFKLKDTAGNDTFAPMRPLSYPETDVFLVCYSVISDVSFQEARTKFVPEIRYHVPNAPFIIVGLKNDLRDDVDVIHKENGRVISQEMGELFAKQSGAVQYLECSALTQDGLKNVMDEAIRSALIIKSNVSLKSFPSIELLMKLSNGLGDILGKLFIL